jgi:hypothetical protein
MQVVAAAVRERHEVDPSGAIIVLKVGPVTVCSTGVDVPRPAYQSFNQCQGLRV